MYISLIAGQAVIEWRCAMCSDDTSVIFQPGDASIPDDDPTLPAVEITRHDSPAKKRPAAFDEVPPKRFQRLSPTSTPTSSQLDRTYIITDRRMIDTVDAASHTVDQSSDRPVFDLGFSGLSSNNQSAPDTSQLVDTSITAAAATQHDEELDLSLRQVPTNNQSAPDISDLGEISITTAAVPRQAKEPDLSRLQVPT